MNGEADGAISLKPFPFDFDLLHDDITLAMLDADTDTSCICINNTSFEQLLNGWRLSPIPTPPTDLFLLLTTGLKTRGDGTGRKGDMFSLRCSLLRVGLVVRVGSLDGLNDRFGADADAGASWSGSDCSDCCSVNTFSGAYNST